MTEFEITNENVEQNLSSDDKRNDETRNIESKGIITLKKKYGTIEFERRLSHPKEMVWNAIADPKEIFRWLPDYKGTFDGYNGGAIDLANTVSGSHVTGDILVWDRPTFLSMSGISLLIKCSLMENLNLLSGGISSRMGFRYAPYCYSQPPQQINSFKFSPWLACISRST